MTKYDRQAAIDKAMELFWQRGYQATTMRDLQQALDMRPGSIYSGFGSKEGLFREVLNCYTQNSLDLLNKHLTQTSDAMAGLERFFYASLEPGDCPSTEPCRICLLTKVVTEIGDSHQELAECARLSLEYIEHAFERALRASQQQGKLEESANCRELACWLQMQMIGLRVYASVQSDPECLRQMVARVFNALPVTS
ncbi:HTH-type transcriptional repressor ComR [Saliniradius amylolyticus]|uniref:HTH-type transcriptional repressor ComR n=1 Tax=Saliniradius amylolyticus TaxID=2183582 RepID=A0A2S2DZ97_9ALTE|nr:TetR/AcrR family transcriptional regulator [Saliniradius amylolyticus]AWL10679.1 HTH-type transcriptional repressor ComR [Saliniradius amylolyticus]